MTNPELFVKFLVAHFILELLVEFFWVLDVMESVTSRDGECDVT